MVLIQNTNLPMGEKWVGTHSKIYWLESSILALLRTSSHCSLVNPWPRFMWSFNHSMVLYDLSQVGQTARFWVRCWSRMCRDIFFFKITAGHSGHRLCDESIPGSEKSTAVPGIPEKGCDRPGNGETKRSCGKERKIGRTKNTKKVPEKWESKKIYK